MEVAVEAFGEGPVLELEHEPLGSQHAQRGDLRGLDARIDEGLELVRLLEARECRKVVVGLRRDETDDACTGALRSPGICTRIATGIRGARRVRGLVGAAERG